MTETPSPKDPFTKDLYQGQEGEDDPLLEGLPETSEEPSGPPEKIEVDETADVIEVEEVPETPEPQEEQVAETPVEEKSERLLADAFKTTEELEKGYRELRTWETRNAQQNARLRREYQQLQAEMQRRDEILRAMAERIDQQGQPPEEYDFEDPQELQRYLDSRLMQARQQWEQESTQRSEQQRQAALAAQIDQSVSSFRARHPEVSENSPLDDAIGETVLKYSLDPDTNRPDPRLFPVTTENLEVALELAQDPSLDKVVEDCEINPLDPEEMALAREARDNPRLALELQADPTLLDSPAGRTVVRQRAGLPAMVQQATQRAEQRADEAVEAQRRAAFVEEDNRTPTVAAPGRTPDGDEFDEVLDSWNDLKARQRLFLHGND